MEGFVHNLKKLDSKPKSKISSSKMSRQTSTMRVLSQTDRSDRAYDEAELINEVLQTRVLQGVI